jgi:hypothetical protein
MSESIVNGGPESLLRETADINAMHDRSFIPTILALCFTFLFAVCLGQAPATMTKTSWMEDIDYLNRKIQKTFQSFIPNIKEGFNQEINALKARLPELQEHEIKIELMRTLSGLKDGHTELNVGQENAGFHRLPVVLYFFGEGLYIINAHEKYRELLGARVLKLGQADVNDAFAQLKTILSHDNEMEFLHAGPGYLKLTEVMKYLGVFDSLTAGSITVEKIDGNVETLTLEGLSWDDYGKGPWLGLLHENKVDAPLYLQQQQKNYWYEYLEDKSTMYFHFRRVNNQQGEPSVKKFIHEMFDVIDEKRPDKLVIDLRNNNGGNYHRSEPLIEAIRARPWLNHVGKVWVITGRTTFSAASVTSIFLRQQTNAQLIGEPGRTDPNLSDNVEYMELPNSRLTIEYTTRIKKHWPELTTNYIPVDIEIEHTFEQYQKGIDPVMEYLSKK